MLSAGDGGIHIGNHVHIAVMGVILGKARIDLEDFANISGRVSIYSSTDDFSGEFMTNPTVPAVYTNVSSSPVRIGRHAIVGAGSVLLPGTILGAGAAVGALSLVRGVLDEFTLYGGIPAVRIRGRSRGLLAREAAFLRGA
ncbi:MAG: acyltransferase [Gemmatimonadales bacterium]